MATATVTSKGQVTIPKSVRDLLRVDAGDQLDFAINDRGEVVVRSLRGDLQALRGILKRPRPRPVTTEEMDEAILEHHTRRV